MDGGALQSEPGALVVAARSGDQRAFAALVERHAGPLHRYLTAFGLDQHDAEDVVQDTFLRVHRHLGSYDPRWAFTTWLYTIARRLALSLRERRRPSTGLDGIDEPLSRAPATDQADGNVWSKARSILNERQFTALWLRYGEERELSEIAQILAITPENTRVLLHRARATLAARLRPEDHP